MPVTNQPTHHLDYASPNTANTPRERFRLRSAHVAWPTIVLMAVSVLMLPPNTGSGVVNPFAALACFASMAAAILYVWLRLLEDRRWSKAAAALVGVCATVAILALPFQFWNLAKDYGEPRPWGLRLKVFFPGMLVCAALLLAALGGGITRQCSGPPRRQAAK